MVSGIFFFAAVCSLLLAAFGGFEHDMQITALVVAAVGFLIGLAVKKAERNTPTPPKGNAQNPPKGNAPTATKRKGLTVRTGVDYTLTLGDLETITCNLQQIHKGHAIVFFYLRASKTDPNAPWQYYATEIRYSYCLDDAETASRLFKQLNLGGGLYQDGDSIDFETTDVSGPVFMETLNVWNDNALLSTFEAWGFYEPEGQGSIRNLENGDLVWSWRGELYY